MELYIGAHVSPSKELSFACPESSSVVTSIVSKTASGHYSPPSARSSGSATSHPPLAVHYPVPSMHHGRAAPPCCPSYDVPRPPSVESSNFPTASDERSDPTCGPSPWTSRLLSSGTPTFSMLSHGSSNTPRSSPRSSPAHHQLRHVHIQRCPKRLSCHPVDSLTLHVDHHLWRLVYSPQWLPRHTINAQLPSVDHHLRFHSHIL